MEKLGATKTPTSSCSARLLRSRSNRSSVNPVVPTTAFMSCSIHHEMLSITASGSVKSTITSAASAGARSSPTSIAATSSRSGAHSTARQTSAPIRPRDPNTPTLVIHDHPSDVSIFHEIPSIRALPAGKRRLNSPSRHPSPGDRERRWVAEQIRCLVAYLFSSHPIEAAQQFAQGALVAEYGVDAQAAHAAASAVVGQRSLAAHLPFGSSQLSLSDALLSHVRKCCPHELENRRQLPRGALP